MKLLVPFDLTEGGEAMRYVAENYNVKDATVEAVHFSERSSDTVDDVIKKEARDTVEETVDGDVELSLSIRVGDVEETTPETVSNAIERFAEASDVDKIVMSESDKSLFERVFKSGHTSRILDSDVAPVELIE